MIIYQNTINSLMKASALGFFFNEMIISEEESKQSLLGWGELQEADQYAWEDIIHKIKHIFQKDISWVQTSTAEKLKQLIYMSLRNQNPDKYPICIKAVQKAFELSPQWIYEQGCEEAKQLTRLYKEVANELHLCQALIRFTPLGEECLIGKPLVTHDIVDLLMIKLKQRYPAYKLVLLLEKDALVLDHNGECYWEQADLYAKCLEEDDFGSYWDTYYRSQYIKERKNIRQASRLLPRKYWHWLQEGRILAEEEAKY